jgi:uncharacterized MAPEG superfamily protein
MPDRAVSGITEVVRSCGGWHFHWLLSLASWPGTRWRPGESNPKVPPLTQETKLTHLLSLVVYMAAITWALLLAASLIRAKGWTPGGMKMAMGNRDNLPDATPFAARADRTAKNTLENFVLFAALALVAHVSGTLSPRVLLGAEVFFWSRLLFIAVYYMGIPYLRTVVWTVGFVGLAMMAFALV